MKYTLLIRKLIAVISICFAIFALAAAVGLFDVDYHFIIYIFIGITVVSFGVDRLSARTGD
jgi:hypothetical protein